MADYNIALGVKPMQVDVATPLLTAGKLQQMQMERQQSQISMGRDAIGAEARGLAPLVGTPDFEPARQAAGVRLTNMRILDHPQAQAGWERDSSSPLGLQSLIARTNPPQMALQQQQLEESIRSHKAGESQVGATLAETKRQHDVTMLAPVKIGTDALNHDIYGIRDPKTGTIIRIDPETGGPMAASQQPTSSNPSSTSSSPDDIEQRIQQLPKQVQNTVRGLVSGDIDISKMSFRDRSPYMNLATMADSSFNTMTAPMRAQAKKNFTGTGVEARNFQSNDMAIKHIGTGLDNIEAMGNYSVPMANTLTAPFARQFSTKYQEARTALGIDIDAIANELMRTFRGSGAPSEKEAMEWREKFPINGSPVEQRTAMREATRLLGGRVTAAGDRYNDAMGPVHARDPLSWLSKEGRDVYERALTLDPQKPIPKRVPSSKVQDRADGPGVPPPPPGFQLVR